MEQDTELIAAEAEREAEQAADSRALYEVKMKFLGRAGKVTELLKGMKNVAQEHRPAFGKKINELRTRLEEERARAERAQSREELRESLARIDEYSKRLKNLRSGGKI